MYLKLKKIIYSIVSKKQLLGYEFHLRKMLYLFYKGKKHQCPVCGSQLRSFIPNENAEDLCPRCGSLPRDRRLFDEFNQYAQNKTGIKVLDFSPSRSISRQLKNYQNIAYYPTDLYDDFNADYKYDITQIPIEDHFFDCIICYHILEHVLDDSTAMKELYRVLKKDGIIFVQTPFKDGEIYENPQIIDPKERLIHFGQDDHVRIYSVEALKNRLSAAGFVVNINQLTNNNYYGFRPETIVVCKK